jgi:hypothetical protein
MDIEQRVFELEKMAIEQGHELMAINILLKALIASHPNHSALRLALESLSANFADQAREHAFTTGRKPQVPESMVKAVQKQVDHWLQILPSG